MLGVGFQRLELDAADAKYAADQYCPDIEVV